jgi:hypothetical protein
MLELRLRYRMVATSAAAFASFLRPEEEAEV